MVKRQKRTALSRNPTLRPLAACEDELSRASSAFGRSCTFWAGLSNSQWFPLTKKFSCRVFVSHVAGRRLLSCICPVSWTDLEETIQGYAETLFHIAFPQPLPCRRLPLIISAFPGDGGGTGRTGETSVGAGGGKTGVGLGRGDGTPLCCVSSTNETQSYTQKQTRAKIKALIMTFC